VIRDSEEKDAVDGTYRPTRFDARRKPLDISCREDLSTVRLLPAGLFFVPDKGR